MAKLAQRALSAPVWYSDDGCIFVLISGQPYFVEAGTLNIDSAIGKRSTCSFAVKTTTVTHFQQYQQVVIYDGNTNLIFSGYIDIPIKESFVYPSTLEHTITCCDQHYLADKRRVVYSAQNTTCGAVAQWIAVNVLAQEGVTIALIEQGLVPSDTLYPFDTLYPSNDGISLLQEVLFGYCPASQALDELASRASDAGIPFYWQIDYLKRFWFVSYTTIINSNIIDGTRIDDGSRTGSAPTVSRQNPAYRNVEYGTGGFAQTLLQTEVKAGDNNATSWTMGFGLASAPTISVNLNGAGYVAQTVGVKGSSGSQFYWAQGDPVIVQDSSQAKLRGPNSPLDLLQVVYYGQFPNVAIAINSAQVAAQAALDGTSGLNEEAFNDTTLSSASSGLAKASQLVQKYGVQGTVFVGSTQQPGYAPGQLVTVDLPMHGLSAVQMLIEEVSVSDSQDGYNIWYTIVAIVGPYDTSWSYFFAKMLAQQNTSSISVGVTQQITILTDLIATIAPVASITATAYACPLPSDTLFPGDTLFPC